MRKSRLRRLREVREMLSDEHLGKCGFTFTREQLAEMERASAHNGGMFAKHAPFVEEVTRLWRHSWILPVLDEVIAEMERYSATGDGRRRSNECKGGVHRSCAWGGCGCKCHARW